MSENLYTAYRHYRSHRPNGTYDTLYTRVIGKHIPEAKAKRMHRKGTLRDGEEWTLQLVLEKQLTDMASKEVR